MYIYAFRYEYLCFIIQLNNFLMHFQIYKFSFIIVNVIEKAYLLECYIKTKKKIVFIGLQTNGYSIFVKIRYKCLLL